MEVLQFTPTSGCHIGFDSGLYRNRWAWSAGGAKQSELHIVINFSSVYSSEKLRLIAMRVMFPEFCSIVAFELVLAFPESQAYRNMVRDFLNVDKKFMFDGQSTQYTGEIIR
jgi:hypothetical protein